MLNRIVSIFSILSVVYSYAQNKVELEISPANVEVGETFSVTVKSTVMGELKFDQVPSSFVQDYNIHHGSSSEKDYNSNTYRVVYFYSFTGKPKRKVNTILDLHSSLAETKPIRLMRQQLWLEKKYL